MALEGFKAVIAGAVHDRAMAAGVAVLAIFLFLTAWILGVLAAVLYLSPHLGMIRALLALAAGLVVLGVLVLWITAARNRRSAELRATTRALWAATAVNAASAILRGEPHPPQGETAQATGGTGHRSAFLIAGGLALILLALLVPGHGGKGTGAPGAGPDDAA